MRTADQLMYNCRRPRRARATCPPTSGPPGSRLIAVTKRPTHPANASGWRANELGSGKKRERRENKMDGRMASPTPVAATGAEAVDRARPARVTGIAIAKPTKGPE